MTTFSIPPTATLKFSPSGLANLEVATHETSRLPLYSHDDWTLFRNLTTLAQKAGVPVSALAALVAKELADNALDAGASASVSMVSPGQFTVNDDGDGIPGTPEEVATLFSIRRPLVSSKILRLPTRGALGNGLRVVAGAVLASAPVQVCSSRQAVAHCALSRRMTAPHASTRRP